jgi:integrase
MEATERAAHGMPINDVKRFYEQAVIRLMAAAGLESPVKQVTWEGWSKQWLEERAAGSRSKVKYTTEVRHFTKYLGKKSSIPLRSLTHADCAGFYRSVIKGGKSASTARQAFKTVRSCLERAKLHGFLDQSPAALVELDDSSGFERKPFSKADIEAIFKQLKKEPNGDEWRIACLFGLLYGVRLRDAIGRRYEEIIEEDGLRILRFVPLKKRRKGKPISLPLVPPLNNLKGSGAITPNVAKINNLSKVFARILKDSGIAIEVTEVKGDGRNQADKTFHSWRHTCNTMLSNAGVDVRIRQLVSDHESQTINARYTHPALESMAKAVKKVAKAAGV